MLLTITLGNSKNVKENNMRLDDYISEIELEEEYINEEYGTTTLYFVAPKEMLNGKYPEAVSMEISVEFPTDYPEARGSTVMFSPTDYDEEEDAYTDYDWFDADLTYEEIEKLIDLAKGTVYE